MYIEKKLLTAYALWLFLGVFGGHKFYLRQPAMGVLYLFTGGLLLLGWLFDFFTLPDQVDACNEREEERLDRTLDAYDQDEIDDLLDEIDELKRMIEDDSSRKELEQLKERLARLESLVHKGAEPAA